MMAILGVHDTPVQSPQHGRGRPDRSRVTRFQQSGVTTKHPQHLPHDVPRIPATPEIVMKPAGGLLGRAAPEDHQTSRGGALGPGQLARVLEGPGDRGLHERGRHAARPELLTQALAA
jgi:hypothetical protein